MDVLFYDKKNKREVKLSQLKAINLVEVGLVVDSEEHTRGEWKGPETHPAYLKQYQLGSVGYKSENCPSHQNWDMWLLDSDLIFLSLIP